MPVMMIAPRLLAMVSFFYFILSSLPHSLLPLIVRLALFRTFKICTSRRVFKYLSAFYIFPKFQLPFQTKHCKAAAFGSVLFLLLNLSSFTAFTPHLHSRAPPQPFHSKHHFTFSLHKTCSLSLLSKFPSSSIFIGVVFDASCSSNWKVPARS